MRLYFHFLTNKNHDEHHAGFPLLSLLAKLRVAWEHSTFNVLVFVIVNCLRQLSITLESSKFDFDRALHREGTKA